MPKLIWFLIGGAALFLIYLYFQESETGVSFLDDGGDDSSTGTSTPSAGGLSGAILGALSSFENVAGIHNNPGAICGGYDASGNCTGPKTYASLEEGIAAAEANIDKYLIKNPSITVAQFVKKWSGGTGQVLTNYTNSVAQALGLDPNEPIADAGGDDDESGGDETDE